MLLYTNRKNHACCTSVVSWSLCVSPYKGTVDTETVGLFHTRVLSGAADCASMCTSSHSSCRRALGN